MLLQTASKSCQTLQRFLRTILHRWWLRELSALAVSALAMIAVVVVLSRIDDMALSYWAFPIQPNSLVSVFMTVSKSALLVPIAECIGQSKWFEFRRRPHHLASLQDFDEASRGPWGSALLLFRPGVVGWIAWSGSLLSVVSMTMDPFTQQILAFPSRKVPSNKGVAQVMTANFVRSIEPAAFQGAILSSIYAPEESYLTYNCTTSSCNWDLPVTTLGVCSACRNITSLFPPECSTSPGPLVPAEGEEWSFSTTTCNYFIVPEVKFPAYIQTLTLPAANGRHAEYANQFTQLRLTKVDPRYGLGSLINDDITWEATILSYATQYNKDIRPMPPLRIQDLRPDIHACGVYFCAQAFQDLAVQNGSLINTFPAVSLPLHYIPDSDGRPEGVLVDGDFSVILALNNTNTDAASFPGNATFLLAQKALFNLQGIVRETFFAIFNLTQSTGNDAFSVFPEPNSGMDGLLKTAYKNMSAAFDHLASGIGGQLRMADGSRPTAGSALADETFVRVRWEWMALPLAVLSCTILLLAGAIVRDHHGGQQPGGATTRRIWKSSSIALLMHPLQGCERQGEEQLSDLEKMDEFARGVKVRLETCGSGNGLGYTFVRVQEETTGK